jgi:hypothetical protein
MLFTKSQNKSTLNRIITEIFEDDEDDGCPGPIWKSLADVVVGVTNPISLTVDDLNNLMCKDDSSDKDVLLKKCDRAC